MNTIRHHNTICNHSLKSGPWTIFPTPPQGVISGLESGGAKGYPPLKTIYSAGTIIYLRGTIGFRVLYYLTPNQIPTTV